MSHSPYQPVYAPGPTPNYAPHYAPPPPNNAQGRYGGGFGADTKSPFEGERFKPKKRINDPIFLIVFVLQVSRRGQPNALKWTQARL